MKICPIAYYNDYFGEYVCSESGAPCRVVCHGCFMDSENKGLTK